MSELVKPSTETDTHIYTLTIYGRYMTPMVCTYQTLKAAETNFEEQCSKEPWYSCELRAYKRMGNGRTEPGTDTIVREYEGVPQPSSCGLI